jgi:uncharacterized membrane protein YcaP (DUF421 family)
MKAEDIHLEDWYRILFGEVPLTFFVEAVFRTAFVFLVLLASMRLLGKRMAGQLNKNEMIGMSTLAAAIGVPLQAPDRGLIPSLIIACTVVLFGRLVSRLSFFYPKFESVSQDKLDVLLKESVIQMKAMISTEITRERLFAQLRSKGIRQLGEVSRVYLEADGNFTIIQNKKPVPGLKLIPDWDTEFVAEQRVDEHTEVCSRCGHTRMYQERTCSNCGEQQWEKACI